MDIVSIIVSMAETSPSTIVIKTLSSWTRDADSWTVSDIEIVVEPTKLCTMDMNSGGGVRVIAGVNVSLAEKWPVSLKCLVPENALVLLKMRVSVNA